MTIQDQSDGPDSSLLLPRGSGACLDSGGEAPTGEGHVPKIRKPYTITKQRERWTEEEHKKFLEALKLHGRAWRKIEEHVGTKTAVQIRSHAQKFFSKVVRESNTAVKPIEIPPPRPKRKPMHPYPRKLVIPVKSDMPPQDQSARSTSPNSPADQEDRSPTSVLSGAASDATDSSTRDRSLSPVSSNDNGSRNLSQSDEPVSLKLELFPNVGSFTNEGSPEVTSSKFLKLFGKTVLLENAENPSSPSTIDPQPMEVGPSAPVPLRVFCRGASFPFLTFDNANSMKEELKEGSRSGLSAGSVNAPSNYRETETQSHQCSLESPTSHLSLSPVARPMLRANLKRANSENYTRAFVPYKRSLSERGTRSSTITAEEKNARETRLCL